MTDPRHILESLNPGAISLHTTHLLTLRILPPNTDDGSQRNFGSCPIIRARDTSFASSPGTCVPTPANTVLLRVALHLQTL